MRSIVDCRSLLPPRHARLAAVCTPTTRPPAPSIFSSQVGPTAGSLGHAAAGCTQSTDRVSIPHRFSQRPECRSCCTLHGIQAEVLFQTPSLEKFAAIGVHSRLNLIPNPDDIRAFSPNQGGSAEFLAPLHSPQRCPQSFIVSKISQFRKRADQTAWKFRIS